MTDDPDAQVLSAAETIRGELDTLAPVDAKTLGNALDEQIGRAKVAPAAERSATVIDIVRMLTLRVSTRRRIVQLITATDTQRFVAAGVWAPDWTIQGTPVNDNDLVPITCKTCSYENELAIYPRADASPPLCQNPEPPQHPLKII